MSWNAPSDTIVHEDDDQAYSRVSPICFTSYWEDTLPNLLLEEYNMDPNNKEKLDHRTNRPGIIALPYPMPDSGPTQFLKIHQSCQGRIPYQTIVQDANISPDDHAFWFNVANYYFRQVEGTAEHPLPTKETQYVDFMEKRLKRTIEYYSRNLQFGNGPALVGTSARCPLPDHPFPAIGRLTRLYDKRSKMKAICVDEIIFVDGYLHPSNFFYFPSYEDPFHVDRELTQQYDGTIKWSKKEITSMTSKAMSKVNDIEITRDKIRKYMTLLGFSEKIQSLVEDVSRQHPSFQQRTKWTVDHNNAYKHDYVEYCNAIENIDSMVLISLTMIPQNIWHHQLMGTGPHTISDQNRFEYIDMTINAQKIEGMGTWKSPEIHEHITADWDEEEDQMVASTPNDNILTRRARQ